MPEVVVGCLQALLPELGALLDVLGSGGEERRGQQVAIRERALRILSRVAARCLCLQATQLAADSQSRHDS